MKPVHLVLMILMNTIWASSFSVFKWLATYLSSGVLVTMRQGIAALLVLATWRWLPGSIPKGRDAALGVLMGVIVFCLAPRLQVEGVHRGRAGDGSVLMALDPLITSLAAALFLRERIPPVQWLGFALGMLGVVLISTSNGAAFQWDGLAWSLLLANCLIVSSFIAETTYSVIGKPILERAGLMKLLGLSLASGSVVNVFLDGPSLLVQLPSLPASGWCLLVYLGLVLTVAGYALWYVVIRETAVSHAALTIYLQPVVGVLLAVFWLGERLHWGQFWGSVAIVLGLVVGLAARPRGAARAGLLDPGARP